MAASPAPPELHVYDVVQDGREVHLLSLLPPEHVRTHGLEGRAVLGSLRVPPREGGKIEPSNFQANPAFVAFLFEFLGRTLPGDPGMLRKAREQGNGWVYLIDRRTPTPQGRVPLEDIIGGVEVRGGELVEGSWTPMEDHRLVTERGVFRLDEFLQPRLMEALRGLGAEGGAGGR